MKKLTARFILFVLTLGLLVVAFGSMFLPYLSADSEAYYTGFRIVFGYSESYEMLGSTITTTYLEFSILAFLEYVFICLPAVIMVLSIINKKFSTLKFKLANIVMLVIAGVLALNTKSIVAPGSAYPAIEALDKTRLDTLLASYPDLGYGAIVFAVAVFTAVVFIVLSILLNDSKKKKRKK